MKTILIVDDEYDIVCVLELSFEMDGYAVRTAFNGHEALACLKEGPRPDLIISDLMMPIMGGLELIQILRNIPAHSDIPVILMSASRPNEAFLKRGGWDLFVMKPFDLNELRDAVERLLKR